MPQITVWQCPQTDELFITKDEYIKHLRTLARERTRRRNVLKYRQQAEERLNHMRNTVSNFEQIEEWFMEQNNAAFIVERLLRLNLTSLTSTEIHPEKFRFTEFKFSNMRWEDKCSNSHHAPAGKKTNWGGREKDYPRGFPGWHGRIRFSYTGARGIWTETLTGTGIHTGSGSGLGNQTYEFDCTLFAEEWAGMTIWHKLSQ